jgi:Fic family protein
MANTPISPATLEKFAALAREVEQRTGSLTIRECMRVWGYRSPAAAVYAMKRLVETGYVTEFPRGANSTTYRLNNLEAIQ